MKITKSAVDGLPAQADVRIYWDESLRGFGIKVMPSGVKTYIIQYRTAGGRAGVTRRQTIGRHGSPWTADTARAEAKLVLGKAAQGRDPVAERRRMNEMPTVSALCDMYFANGTGTKKASTLSTDRGRVERHIKPLLGKRKISAVTKVDLRQFLRHVADGKNRR